MGVVEAGAEVALAVGFGKQFLAPRGSDALLGGEQIRTGAHSERFEIFEAGVDGLVIQLALDIEKIGDGFETDELAECGNGLNFRESGGGEIGLKLEKLEFDFEVIALAHVAGFIALLADVDCFLETVEILFGKIDRGLREDDVDELLGNVEDEGALVVGDLRASDGGLILGGLQAMLAFLAALEGVAEAQVELSLVVDVIGIELARLKDGQELRVPGDDGVGTEIGGGFERLVLQDGGTSGLESVVVLEGEADGFVESDAHGRSLLWCRSRERRCSRRRRGILLGEQTGR